VEIYGYSIQAFGLIFALAGLSILAGSIINRLLVTRFELLPLISIGVALMAFAALQFLIIAWLDTAPFAWVWSSVCIFFFSVPIILSNAMVLALDPLPRIAGVASSIIGTLQNVVGAVGALVGAALYDGSVRNAVLLIACAGVIVTCTFLLRARICGGPIVHHAEELVRD
jgi:DHA1 family bicyclomycin/chloramphenicol resistance-like MFS transporter